MYAIQLTNRPAEFGNYVAGINRHFGGGTVATVSPRAKQFIRQFRTEAAAAKWIRKYADIGYAMTSADAKIVPVTSIPE